MPISVEPQTLSDEVSTPCRALYSRLDASRMTMVQRQPRGTARLVELFFTDMFYNHKQPFYNYIIFLLNKGAARRTAMYTMLVGTLPLCTDTHTYTHGTTGNSDKMAQKRWRTTPLPLPRNFAAPIVSLGVVFLFKIIFGCATRRKQTTGPCTDAAFGSNDGADGGRSGVERFREAALDRGAPSKARRLPRMSKCQRVTFAAVSAPSVLCRRYTVSAAAWAGWPGNLFLPTSTGILRRLPGDRVS